MNVPDDLKGWLQAKIVENRSQANARRQYAANNKNLSPSDRKAAQLIAEQMCGRKLPKTSAVQEEAYAQAQENIASRLESEALMLEGFIERIAALEAENARLSAPVTDAEWNRFHGWIVFDPIEDENADSTEIPCMKRNELDAFLAARKGAA